MELGERIEKKVKEFAKHLVGTDDFGCKKCDAFVQAIVKIVGIEKAEMERLGKKWITAENKVTDLQEEVARMREQLAHQEMELFTLRKVARPVEKCQYCGQTRELCEDSMMCEYSGLWKKRPVEPIRIHADDIFPPVES